MADLLTRLSIQCAVNAIAVATIDWCRMAREPPIDRSSCGDFQRLEPHSVKVARTVLREARVSDGLGLPD